MDNILLGKLKIASNELRVLDMPNAAGHIDAAYEEIVMLRQKLAAVSEATKKLQAELAQSKKCHEFEQDMRIEDEKKLAATERKLAEQQAAFHVNMLRAWPEKSHDEIANAIQKINPPTELTKLLSEAEQRGRDALMKELREQKPVGQLCKGCGSSWNDERLAEEKRKNPRIVSCCPDRKMIDVYANPMPAPNYTWICKCYLGLSNGSY